MKNDIIYIRVFATLLVVLGHSWLYNGFSGFTEADIPGALTGSWLYGLNHFIYTFHMPLFFAVSGYLVALSVRRKGQIDAKSWLRKKAFRLLLPFFVVTLFFCLPIKWVAGFFGGETLGNVLWSQFVKAEGAHTWFMLALFWCMLIGLLVALTELRHKRWFWPLLLVLLGVHFIGIPRFANVVDIFCLGKGLRFSIYFLFGYLLERRTTITPPYWQYQSLRLLHQNVTCWGSILMRTDLFRRNSSCY